MKKAKIIFTFGGICLFLSIVFLFTIPSSNEYDYFVATESNTTEYAGTIRSITSDKEGYRIQVEEHDITLFVSFDFNPSREVLQEIKTGEKIFYRFYIGTTIDSLEEFGAKQDLIVMLKTEGGEALSLKSFNESRKSSFEQLKNFGYGICLLFFIGSVILFVRGFMVWKGSKSKGNQ